MSTLSKVNFFKRSECSSLLQPSKMPKRKTAKGTSAVPKKQEAKKVSIPFEKKPNNFGTGQDVQPKRDLAHSVKRPHYIGLQQQSAALYECVKVPPAINQSTQALNRQTVTQLLKLAHKYRPETKHEKKQRSLAQAEKIASGKGDVPIKKPPVLQAGVNTANHLSGKQESSAGSDCTCCGSL